MKFKYLLLIAVVSIALRVIFNYFSNISTHYKALNRDKKHSLENWAKYGLPANINHPILLKNAININKQFKNTNGNINDDYIQISSDRISSHFGNRIIKTFNPKNKKLYGVVSSSSDDGLNNSVLIDLNTYLNDDHYINHTVAVFHQLGTVTEYNNFLGYNNNKNSIFMELTKNKYINTRYQGSEFFMARSIGTGTPLHFAWGKNVFFMLGGRKRWILINPNNAFKFQCNIEAASIFGRCLDSSNATIGDMDIDKYVLKYIKQFNLTKENNDYYDIVLEPGDVLLVPELWLHTIENITPSVFAFAMRFVDSKLSDSFGDTKISIYLVYAWQSIVNSIKQKYNNLNSYTWLDGLYLNEFTNGPYNVLDYHPYFILN